MPRESRSTSASVPARRRGSLPLRPGGNSWAGCVEEFIASERLKGRRPRTLQLHRENLKTAELALAALTSGTHPRRR